MPKQGLQDGHGNAGIPVVSTKGVAERMPAETWNPQKRTCGPRVPAHEVPVAERRPHGARKQPVRTCWPHAEPVLEDWNERRGQRPLAFAARGFRGPNPPAIDIAADAHESLSGIYVLNFEGKDLPRYAGRSKPRAERSCAPAPSESLRVCSFLPARESAPCEYLSSGAGRCSGPH